MLAQHDATILRWTNMLVQHYATMSDTLGQHGGSVIRDLSEISRGGMGVGNFKFGFGNEVTHPCDGSEIC